MYNGLQLYEVKALHHFSSLADFLWLLFCIGAVSCCFFIFDYQHIRK